MALHATTAMELRLAPGYEVFLCNTNLTNCPNTIAITGLDYNTDETSAAATFPAQPTIGGAPYPTTPITLSACTNCSSVTLTASATAIGSVPITFTDSIGFTRVLWAHVNTSNVMPHWGTDLNTYTAYTAGKSFLPVSLFATGGPYLQDTQYPAFSSMPKDMFNSGVLAAETGLSTPETIGGTYSQAHYASALATQLTANTALLNGYAMFFNYTGDSWIKNGSPGLFEATQKPAASWTPTAMATAVQALQTAANVLTVQMCDECDTSWEQVPAGTVTWSKGLTSVTWNGTTVTMTCTNYSQTAGLAITTGCPYNAAKRGIMTGTGVTGLDYANDGVLLALTVTTTGGNGGWTTITFPQPAGLAGSGSLTSGGNPGALFNWAVAATFNSSYSSSCTPPNCTLYILNNSISQLMSQYITGAGSVTTAPLVAIEESGLNQSYGGTQNWMGDQTLTGTATMYYFGNTATPTSFMPNAGALWNYSYAEGGPPAEYRTKYSVLGANRLQPITGEVSGITQNYGFEGLSVAVASCLGNTVTFSAPHGLNNIFPWASRFSILGSATCDGSYYVTGIPNSTSLTVALQKPTSTGCYAATTSPCSGNTTAVTATLDTGGTFQILYMDATASGTYSSRVIGQNDGASNCTYTNNRGHSFTTATGVSALDNATWFMIPAPYGQSCVGNLLSNRGIIAQVPNFASGTGGTALITNSNGYRAGVNYVNFSSFASPRWMHASIDLNVVLGARMLRWYYGGFNNNYSPPGSVNYSTVFNDTAASFQAAVHPRFNEFGRGQVDWDGGAEAIKLWSALAPCIDEQRLSAPDLGLLFETARFVSSTCNAIIGAMLNDGPGVTRTVDISGIVVSGQPTYQYCSGQNGITIRTIAIGVTSDTFTFSPDACLGWAYTAATNWLTFPVLGLKLSDCPSGSTGLSVQWSYSPIALSGPVFNGSVVQTTNAGAATGVTLPVDKRIGTVYYRPVCYSTMGPTATGDVQTF
jgi:hypothetical protein